MKKTRGQTALARHARDAKTVTALARRLGYSRQRVANWISGECRPDAVAQLCMQADLGIEPSWWHTARRRAR